MVVVEMTHSQSGRCRPIRAEQRRQQIHFAHAHRVQPDAGRARTSRPRHQPEELRGIALAIFAFADA